MINKEKKWGGILLQVNNCPFPPPPTASYDPLGIFYKNKNI
jgi:hypothetical protein